MRDITENTEDEVIDENLFVQSNGKLSQNGDRINDKDDQKTS